MIRATLTTLAAAATIATGAAIAQACPAPAPPPPSAQDDSSCYSQYNPFTDTFEWQCGLGD